MNEKDFLTEKSGKGVDKRKESKMMPRLLLLGKLRVKKIRNGQKRVAVWVQNNTTIYFTGHI